MEQQLEQNLSFLNQAIDLAVDYGLGVLGALAILIVGWIVAGWARRGVLRALDRTPRVDETLKPIIASIVRYGILVFVLIAILAQFGVQTASIIALLGAAGGQLVAAAAVAGALEAYDGDLWYPSWDSDFDGLPLAIRVTVVASGCRDGADPVE